MTKFYKKWEEILTKLGISDLNQMQDEAIATILKNDEVILLSPTGTGKTIAFLLPILDSIQPDLLQVQTLILVPTRELAIQIEQVVRKLGSGIKVNAIYGGRSGQKDQLDLKQAPALLVGTPGRIADHFRRGTFETKHIKTIVLDEFDKSLEIGFENEMREILEHLEGVSKKILTSASQKVVIPEFVHLKDPKQITFSDQGTAQLELKMVISPEKDKLQALLKTLLHIGNQPGIIFCNFKDTIEYISEFLTQNRISHGCFYGGMEQYDRELALIKFRNGTHQLLIATDLAARGIDIPELKFIIHYQLPLKEHEFMHRNGRTARMNSEGTAYILKWQEEYFPKYLDEIKPISVNTPQKIDESPWETLCIMGGRRDKISKGDIAGLFFKQGGLTKEELGVIEVQQDRCYVAVHHSKVEHCLETLHNKKLKEAKIRISWM
jgi:superfamily II DNA/RNA helicase